MIGPLAIVAAAARTPIGLDARSTALSWRAGRTGLAGAPFAGAARDQIVAGVVATMPWTRTAAERASDLACGALREALASLPAPLAGARLAVLVTTSDAVDASAVAAHVIAALETALGVARPAPAAGPIEVRAEGAASSGDALARAAALLETRAADVVLWGGAHSDVAPEQLRALSRTSRLFDAQHLDAVVPGEAAAFIALTAPARAGAGALATITGFGGATSRATPFDEAPVDGDAMVEAMRAAMATGGEEAPAGWVLSDVGYEALRLREWEMVQVRARTLLGIPYRWDAMPQRLGRAGAAHLPLAAAIASVSFAMGHVPSPSVLAIAGTDAGRRAALWLRAPAGSDAG